MEQGHFTPINFTSATLSDFGGIKTGHRRFYYNQVFNCMQTYVLVKANTTTIADGCLCRVLTTAQTAGRNGVINVLITNNGAAVGYCVNNSGATITDLYYWWGLQRGLGYGLGLGNVAQTGLAVSPAANGGIAASSAATDTIAGIAITALTSSLTNTIDWMLPAFGPAA